MSFDISRLRLTIILDFFIVLYYINFVAVFYIKCMWIIFRYQNKKRLFINTIQN
jgi:hypothetical protein